MLTNTNLFTAMDGLSRRLVFTPDSVNLVAMPLFHIGGGGWACVGLTAGCEDVIVREVDPAAIGKIIEERKVTHAFLVPAVLQFMCMLPDIDEHRLLRARDDRLRRLTDLDDRCSPTRSACSGAGSPSSTG